MRTEHEELTAAYLAELEREAARLPWNAREELLEDVRSHIEVALAEMREAAGSGISASAGRDETSQVRVMLAALGEPREIVAAALADMPHSDDSPGASPDAAPPYPLSGQEVLAILLLPMGGFLFGIGWIFGAVLLWNGRRWTTREKLLGTFVVPGGYATLLYLLSTAAPGGRVMPQWLAIPLVVFLLVGPLVSAVILCRNARKRPTEHRATRNATGNVILGVVAGVALWMIAGAALFMASSTSSGSGSGEGTVGPVRSAQPPASSESASQVQEPVSSAPSSSQP